MDELIEKNSPNLKADLFLVHAPSVYDFRDRDDMLFAFLSDSDSVNVTSIFEMYPLGFLAIQAHLQEAGFDVKIVNLASLMLQYPNIQVEKLLSMMDAPVFGLDLHWMAHCHGAIEVADLIKKVHPDARVIFGGISATYYAAELIQYPSVDVVFKGYDTLLPLQQYLQVIRGQGGDLIKIPNIVYKAKGEEIVTTGFTHKPTEFYNNATIDWSFYTNATGDPKTTRLIMTLPNTGCKMNCPWCGGSKFAFKNLMGVDKTYIEKDNRRITQELRTLKGNGRATSIYALQCYSESRKRLFEYLDVVKDVGIKSVYFEQTHLPDHEMMVRMGEATRAYILLSPESHDRSISRRSGRGAYSMAEMEAWIPQAIDADIAGIMVWFFIGMPGQTAQSVLDTVQYCERLIVKFPRENVIPLICPMVPFLDPGSQLFEEPQKFGYRLFYRSLREHREAMIAPVWYQRLNYETDWMTRKEIQDVTYRAVGDLVRIKAERHLLPRSIARSVQDMIEETTTLLAEVERAIALDGQLPPQLKKIVKSYNRKILGYSTDQIIPTQRPFGGRWFDDFTVPDNLIKAAIS